MKRIKIVLSNENVSELLDILGYVRDELSFDETFSSAGKIAKSIDKQWCRALYGKK